MDMVDRDRSDWGHGCDEYPNGFLGGYRARWRMKLEEFYADKRRRTSGEVPLGEDWTSRTDPDATYKLFWLLETGEVCALRIGPVVMIPRPPTLYGVYVPKMASVGVENNEVSVLGQCGQLPKVKELVAGAQQKTIEWMRQELGRPG